jgi:demethylmenaquinone methyltransferase/2-methoxy-6-polyprenyl-1,4-benzoquinol methylase
VVGDDAGDRPLLDEQQTFYRRRAPEYDDWWLRRGRYTGTAEERDQWNAEVAEVEAALAGFDPAGAVLELAGGTGWWTERLARRAGELTVVDASPETLALNRERVNRPDARYVEADLFSWEPDAPASYDVVFFSFWLSHVPRSRFEGFWELVRRCLAPGGRVFLVDNWHDPARTRAGDPFTVGWDFDGDIQFRTLSDGSEHRVVKIFYEPADLMAQLTALGWRAHVRRTASAFIYGTAAPG